MLIDHLRAMAVIALAILTTGCAGGAIQEQRIARTADVELANTRMREPPATTIDGSVATARMTKAQTATDEVKDAIALMAKAQAATSEDWSRLHQRLVLRAAMNPAPHARANVAFALSQGQRSSEELQRARRLMETLLRKTSQPNPQGHRPATLSPQMRQLVGVQYEQLLRRLELEHKLTAAESSIDRMRAKLTIDATEHAKTKQERDKAFGELKGTREQLRAVTRIELKHQSNGG